PPPAPPADAGELRKPPGRPRDDAPAGQRQVHLVPAVANPGAGACRQDDAGVRRAILPRHTAMIADARPSSSAAGPPRWPLVPVALASSSRTSRNQRREFEAASWRQATPSRDRGAGGASSR